MQISDIADSNQTIELEALTTDRELTRELQERLAEIGLLDPPADGKFGPVSRWALREFKRLSQTNPNGPLDRATAAALLDDAALTLLPFQPGNQFGARIASYMKEKGYWLARHPEAVNIVYVEGADPDGTLNDNEPNQFNDARLALRFMKTGRVEILGAWEGTTEPGRFWTNHPMNPDGAARIAFGQYKAWTVGRHHPGQAGEHEALVQVDKITVYRDLNQDFSRSGDRTAVGSGFAINQHWGYDLPRNDLGRSSAGCLVGRTKSGHREFMKIVKADPRYMVNNGYRFMTTVIEGSKLT